MQDIIEFVRINVIWCIVWAGLLAAIIYMTVKLSFSKVKEIGHTETTLLMNQHDAVVVDLRAHDAFRQGHIAGSLNVAPSEISSNNIAALEKHKDKPIVVVCANGTASRRPAEELSKLGFEKVYMLKEGIAGWNANNLPLVRHGK